MHLQCSDVCGCNSSNLQPITLVEKITEIECNCVFLKLWVFFLKMASPVSYHWSPENFVFIKHCVNLQLSINVKSIAILTAAKCLVQLWL